jgi:flagellar biosynthesis/type III secretory pathway protein FliH
MMAKYLWEAMMATSSNWSPSPFANGGIGTAHAPAWIAGLGAKQSFKDTAPWDTAGAQAQPIDAATTARNTGGYEAGFAQGLKQGITQGLAQGQSEGRAAANLDLGEANSARASLSLAFQKLDEAAAKALCDHLTETVATLCAQVIEPQMVEPAMLKKRCEKLASAIGEAPANCSLHIHSDDAELIAPYVLDEWQICTDDSLTRGSLVLEGPGQLMADGPDQWNGLIADALRAASATS